MRENKKNYTDKSILFKIVDKFKIRYKTSRFLLKFKNLYNRYFFSPFVHKGINDISHLRNTCNKKVHFVVKIIVKSLCIFRYQIPITYIIILYLYLDSKSIYDSYGRLLCFSILACFLLHDS